jgi:arylmalonate decarboxylase
MTSRRRFLQAALAAPFLMAAGAPRPLLGLITPDAASPPPPPPVEAEQMYPGRMRYQVEGIGLARMTPEGFDSVLERIAPAAERLARAGVDGIVLLGTSLSFYQGAAFNRILTERVQKASGLRCVTMSTAVVEALRRLEARRVVVASAYNLEVNGRLDRFLREEGFDPLVIRGLGLEETGRASEVTPDSLLEFVSKLSDASPGAEAILVSSGGLNTLDLLAPLERRCGRPVVASMPHTLWAGARLVGLDGRAKGYGRLLSL